MNGEWRLDSSSNSFYRNITIIFNEGDYYKFYWSDGGSLSDYGQIITQDSIQGLYKYWKYHYQINQVSI